VRTLLEVIDDGDLGFSAEKVVELVEAVLGADGARGAVTVVCVDEPAIAELNLRYRGLDEPTDVLSFSYGDDWAGWPTWPSSTSPVGSGPAEGESLPDLGEVIVCPTVVRRYAQEDGLDVCRQLGWTIIHGVLHLLGYDHERDEGEMRRREQALLEELGPVLEALSPSTNA
jgi:probable rRNA maturation factor